jgi:hypothetical protein
MDDLNYILHLAGLPEKQPLTESAALTEKSPKGWEGTVKAMKKHNDIDNPWALSHWMKNRGAHSHYTKSGKKKRNEDAPMIEAKLLDLSSVVEKLLNGK